MQAKRDLDLALADLAGEATSARKALQGRARRPVDTTALLAGVVAAYRAVTAAEEALDIAQLDLAAASGQDV